MRFENIRIFLLFVPVVWLWFAKTKNSFPVGWLWLIKKKPKPAPLRQLPKILYFILLGALIFLVASPFKGYEFTEETKRKLNIMMVLDFSGSMGDKQETLKEIAASFIQKRCGGKDKFGLVVFSDEAFSRLLTSDCPRLKKDILSYNTKMPQLGGGTEVGEGLYSAFIVLMLSYLHKEFQIQGFSDEGISEKLKVLPKELGRFRKSLLRDEDWNYHNLYLPKIDEIKNTRDVGKGTGVILVTDEDFPDRPAVNIASILKTYQEFGIRIYLISLKSDSAKIRKLIEETGGGIYSVSDIGAESELNRAFKAIDSDIEMPKYPELYVKYRSLTNYFWPAIFLLPFAFIVSLFKKYQSLD